MNNIVLKGQQFLEGTINVPASKSLCHRALIAAGLSKGNSVIDNLSYSVDINATLRAMEQIGSQFIVHKNSAEVTGNNGVIKVKNATFNCEESGSTLRFMIPIAMNSKQPVCFKGNNALVTRPLTPYLDIFKKQGIDFEYEDQLPLIVKRPLNPGRYVLPGNVSSQFVSGLLFILPLLKGDSVIEVLDPFESKDYVTLTIDVLRDFGVHIQQKENLFMISGGQSYIGHNYSVEGDYSQLAFWLTAGLINGNITAKGMKMDSHQGDRQVLDVIKAMGGQIAIDEKMFIAKKQILKSTIIDGSQCPDIIPILAVLAALTPGETKIINASRLRLKECDRLKAIATELNALGADIVETKDGLIIQGKNKLKGGKVKGWNDHRIVMSLVIASLGCQEKVYIEGCHAITKSYPDFLRDFKALGGEINEWYMEA